MIEEECLYGLRFFRLGTAFPHPTTVSSKGLLKGYIYIYIHMYAMKIILLLQGGGSTQVLRFRAGWILKKDQKGAGSLRDPRGT